MDRDALLQEPLPPEAKLILLALIDSGQCLPCAYQYYHGMAAYLSLVNEPPDGHHRTARTVLRWLGYLEASGWLEIEHLDAHGARVCLRPPLTEIG